jgi:hypothetical protein
MTKDTRPRRCCPHFEGLEARELLSALAVRAPSARHETTPNLNLLVASETAAYTGAASVKLSNATSGKSAGTPSWVNESFLQSLVGQLYAPVTTSTPINVQNQTFPAGTYAVPQPTPSEVRRETFWLQFQGHYSVGAPRFSNQSSTVHIYSNGRSTTSNTSLNGRAQLILFPPADPTATPTTLDPIAGQVTGLLSVFSANVLQSGSVLFAEVTNVPGVASNDPTALNHGLPSHLEFLIDPNGVSGGLFSTPSYSTTPATVTDPATGQPLGPIAGNGGAVAFNQGAGIVDITYIPEKGRHAGAIQSGKVIVKIQGLINTTGVLNPIYKGIN